MYLLSLETNKKNLTDILRIQMWRINMRIWGYNILVVWAFWNQNTLTMFWFIYNYSRVKGLTVQWHGCCYTISTSHTCDGFCSGKRKNQTCHWNNLCYYCNKDYHIHAETVIWKHSCKSMRILVRYLPLQILRHAAIKSDDVVQNWCTDVWIRRDPRC